MSNVLANISKPVLQKTAVWVDKELSAGIPPTHITTSLQESGWTAAQAQTLVTHILQKRDAKIQANKRQSIVLLAQQQITTGRNYIFIGITLFASACALNVITKSLGPISVIWYGGFLAGLITILLGVLRLSAGLSKRADLDTPANPENSLPTPVQTQPRTIQLAILTAALLVLAAPLFIALPQLPFAAIFSLFASNSPVAPRLLLPAPLLSLIVALALTFLLRPFVSGARWAGILLTLLSAAGSLVCCIAFFIAMGSNARSNLGWLAWQSLPGFALNIALLWWTTQVLMNPPHPHQLTGHALTLLHYLEETLLSLGLLFGCAITLGVWGQAYVYSNTYDNTLSLGGLRLLDLGRTLICYPLSYLLVFLLSAILPLPFLALRWNRPPITWNLRRFIFLSLLALFLVITFILWIFLALGSTPS